MAATARSSRCSYCWCETQSTLATRRSLRRSTSVRKLPEPHDGSRNFTSRDVNASGIRSSIASTSRWWVNTSAKPTDPVAGADLPELRLERGQDRVVVEDAGTGGVPPGWLFLRGLHGRLGVGPACVRVLVGPRAPRRGPPLGGDHALPLSGCGARPVLGLPLAVASGAPLIRRDRAAAALLYIATLLTWATALSFQHFRHVLRGPVTVAAVQAEATRLSAAEGAQRYGTAPELSEIMRHYL